MGHESAARLLLLHNLAKKITRFIRLAGRKVADKRKSKRRGDSHGLAHRSLASPEGKKKKKETKNEKLLQQFMIDNKKEEKGDEKQIHFLVKRIVYSCIE